MLGFPENVWRLASHMVDPWEVNLTTSPRGENGGNLEYYLALS